MSENGLDRRVIAIGLDGYEPAIAEQLMAEGRMPNLASLIEESARFTLDHGKHRLTGLAWEHFSTGLTPDAMGRFGAVHFGKGDYRTRQKTSRHPPFLAGLERDTVVFDAPYFDLDAVPAMRGLVNWGAHDPGVPATSHPADLSADIAERFGRYAAKPYIYGFCWPDPQGARRAGEALTAALDQRAAITGWLLGERFPEWRLGITVVSELHSAIEPLWHGFDVDHPLHDHPSGAPARQALEDVYLALDRMIGDLAARFPDAAVLAFSMHGMGINNADVPAMLLLPEFCLRRSLGIRGFTPRREWEEAYAAGTPPPLKPGEGWEAAVGSCLDFHMLTAGAGDSTLDRLAGKLGKGLARLRGHDVDVAPGEELGLDDFDLSWMPAWQYRKRWPEMDCFAIPAFYDGRVRVNLEGREAAGRVSRAHYHAFVEALEQDLMKLINPATGKPAIAAIERICWSDPESLSDTQGDLEILWQPEAILALDHTEYGRIGPAPFRRTGGHTGGDGVLYIAGGPQEPGDYGLRDAFDVAPSLIALLGMPPSNVSGASVLAAAPV